MGGNKIECNICGTHWQVVEQERAKVIADTHAIICRDHEIAVKPIALEIEMDMRELDTAPYMNLVDLLEGLE